MYLLSVCCDFVSHSCCTDAFLQKTLWQFDDAGVVPSLVQQVQGQ